MRTKVENTSTHIMPGARGPQTLQEGIGDLRASREALDSSGPLCLMDGEKQTQAQQAPTHTSTDHQSGREPFLGRMDSRWERSETSKSD